MDRFGQALAGLDSGALGGLAAELLELLEGKTPSAAPGGGEAPGETGWGGRRTPPAPWEAPALRGGAEAPEAEFSRFRMGAGELPLAASRSPVPGGGGASRGLRGAFPGPGADPAPGDPAWPGAFPREETGFASELEAISDAFRRDSRRYDCGFGGDAG